MLVLSRQNLPTLDRTQVRRRPPASPRAPTSWPTRRTASPTCSCSPPAARSALCVAAYEQLAKRGHQGARRQHAVAGSCSSASRRPTATACCRRRSPPASPSSRPRRFGWAHYVGIDGAIIGMHTFGASAPLKDAAEEVRLRARARGRSAACERRPARETQPDHQRSSRSAAHDDGTDCAASGMEGAAGALTPRCATCICASSSPTTRTRGERLAAEAAGLLPRLLEEPRHRRDAARCCSQLAEECGLRGAHRRDVPRRQDQHHREARRAARGAARAARHARSSSTAPTSCPRCTRCSTGWRPSPTASAAATGRATPASASATSSTSASAAPTSAR